MSDTRVIPYSLEYKQKCKTTWYANGQVPEPGQIRKMLIKAQCTDEHGRVPAATVLTKWIQEDGWWEWGDVMNAQALSLVETDLIQQKAKMLREQAERGFSLQELGLKYLKTDGFDSSSAAVQAVVRGAELERTSRGIGEMLVKMAKMTDEDLKKEITDGLRQMASAGQIIDAEEVIENDTESPESPE